MRCPTPASTRHSLNFSTVFGYKHEIETRYEPDKRYLLEKRIPPKSEYDIIRGSHPNYSTLADQDPDNVIAYSRAVLDFRRKYAGILYDGDPDTILRDEKTLAMVGLELPLSLTVR